MIKALVAYWLGALTKVVGSNPGGSMNKYFHMYNGCWYLLQVLLVGDAIWLAISYVRRIK